MLLLEIHQQVLQKFLIFHEQVQRITQAFYFLIVVLSKIKFRLDAENFLVLIEDVLEKLKVVELDLGWGGILGGTPFVHFISAVHALELISRFAALKIIGVTSSISRNTLLETMLVANLLLVSLSTIFARSNLMQ